MCRIAVAIAAVLCACSGGAKTVCSSDAECGFGGFCDPELKSCLEKQCNPACPAWQICASQGCVARYGAISVLEPAANGTVDGGVHVHAQLALAQNVVLRDDPATLDVLINGADGGLLTLGTLSATDAGDYAGNAYATYEGPATLVVQYRDASLKSAPVPLTFDQTGPVFAVEVPMPQNRRDGSAGQPNDIDPAMGYANAWKRNETVTLKITSTATDVDPASVHVSVGGIGGPGVDGNASTCTSGSGYCGEFTVDLSKPALKAFRENFPITVTGADRAGNPTTADGGIAVTRWNWAADAGGPVQLTPAVASDGTVMVANNAGSVVALKPDGTTKWLVTPGSITGGPAIGANDRVYVSATSSNQVSLIAYANDGGFENRCDLPGSVSSQSIVLTSVDLGQGRETGVIVANDPAGGTSNGGQLAQFRPDELLPAKICYVSSGFPELYSASASSPGAAVSANGSSLFWVDANTNIQAHDVTASGVSQKAGWPVATQLSSQGLAIAGADIVGGGRGGRGQGGVYAIHEDGGSVFWMYPDGGMSSPTYLPAVGDGGLAVAGTDALELIGATIGADAGVSTSTPSKVIGAPLFGADGRLYAVSSTGSLVVLASNDFSTEWAQAVFGNVFASPVLDCARSGGMAVSGPGRLLVASNNGQVYSVLVDSHGIDVSAPWPMYQHDPRLTGNSATPLDPEFRCP